MGRDYLAVPDAIPALWVHLETRIAGFVSRDELPVYLAVLSFSLYGTQSPDHPQSVYSNQHLCDGGISLSGDKCDDDVKRRGGFAFIWTTGQTRLRGREKACLFSTNMLFVRY